MRNFQVHLAPITRNIRNVAPVGVPCWFQVTNGHDRTSRNDQIVEQRRFVAAHIMSALSICLQVLFIQVTGWWFLKFFKTYFWLSPYPYLDPHTTKIAHDVLLCKVIQYFGFKPNDNIWQWWSPTFGRGVFPRAKRRPRGHLTLFTKAAMVFANFDP